MKKLAYLLPVLMLCACASGPRYAGMIQPVQSKSAQLVIYRPDHFLMFTRSAPININGQDRCDLANNGYAVLQIQPGKTAISASLWDMPGTSRLTMNTVAGHRYYVEVGADAGKTISMAGGGLIGAMIAENTSDNAGPFTILGVNEDTAKNNIKETTLLDCK